MKIPELLVLLFLSIFLAGCKEEVLPKPKGYFRIDLPEKKYAEYSGNCPFTTEIPEYSRVEVFEKHNSGDSCWFNIVVPRYNARIHCTYVNVQSNLDKLLRDSYEYAFKHEVKATAIERIVLEDDESKVYGLVYDIKGDVASQVQFYLTDSSAHFLRGSLYFQNTPNADSLAPVVAFLKEDILHLAETLEWGTENPTH
jgi:gliding motility-associated lipoprotein GldD